MSIDALTPAQIELLARLVRAYRCAPAARDLPTIESLDKLLANTSESH